MDTDSPFPKHRSLRLRDDDYTTPADVYSRNRMGSLKPHAEVFRRFSSTRPVVQPARRLVTLAVTPEEYYADPLRHARETHRRFQEGGSSTSS